MLWLIGALSVVVVGGVACLDLSSEPDEADEDAARDADILASEHGFGLLLNEIETQKAVEAVPEPDDAELAEISQTLHGGPAESNADTDMSGDALPEQTEPDMETALDETQENTPIFDDIDVETEELVLIWDDSEGDEPEAYLTESLTDPDLLELKLGNEVMARVPASCGMTPEHVALIPRSAAEAMGWGVEGSPDES